MTTPPPTTSDSEDASTVDTPSGHTSQESPSTLDGAQSLVRRAIRQLAVQGSLPPERAEELLAQVPRHATRFALSQWVFDTEPINAMFCNYPECFRNRRKYGGRGGPPKHCDLRDPRNAREFAHTPTTSRQRRQALTKQAAGVTPARKSDDEEDERRPISHARESIPTMMATLLDEARAFNSRVAELAEHVQTVGDPEARDIEIETVRLEAQRSVDEETGRALALAQRVRTLESEAASLRGQLLEAHEAANEADQRSAARTAERDQAAEERDQAVAEQERISREATQAVADAVANEKWLVAEALYKAEQQLAVARAELDAELGRRTTQMNAEIQAANTTRDEALEQAALREAEAGKQVERAMQKAADAETERADAKAEAKQLRADLKAAQDTLQQREQHHENAAREREERHRVEIAELRGAHDRLVNRIDELHREREQHDANLRAEHERALTEQDRLHNQQVEQLRVAYERSLTDRDELHTTAKTNAAEAIEALKSSVEQLRLRAERAEAEVDELRSASHTEPPSTPNAEGDTAEPRP